MFDRMWLWHTFDWLGGEAVVYLPLDAWRGDRGVECLGEILDDDAAVDMWFCGFEARGLVARVTSDIDQERWLMRC